MTAKKKPAKKVAKTKNDIQKLFEYFAGCDKKVCLTHNPNTAMYAAKYIVMGNDGDLINVDTIEQAVDDLVENSGIDTLLDATPSVSTKEDLANLATVIQQVTDLPKSLSYSEIFWFFVSTDYEGNTVSILKGNEDNKLIEKAGKKVHSLAVTYLKDYYETRKRSMLSEEKEHAEQLSRIEDSERAQLKNLMKKYYPDLVKNVCG